jgi:hypothetical protein
MSGQPAEEVSILQKIFCSGGKIFAVINKEKEIWQQTETFIKEAV